MNNDTIQERDNKLKEIFSDGIKRRCEDTANRFKEIIAEHNGEISKQYIHRAVFNIRDKRFNRRLSMRINRLIASAKLQTIARRREYKVLTSEHGTLFYKRAVEYIDFISL